MHESLDALNDNISNTIETIYCVSKNIDPAPMSTNVMFIIVFSSGVLYFCWLNGKESILAMSGQHIEIRWIFLSCTATRTQGMTTTKKYKINFQDRTKKKKKHRTDSIEIDEWICSFRICWPFLFLFLHSSTLRFHFNGNDSERYYIIAYKTWLIRYIPVPFAAQMILPIMFIFFQFEIPIPRI